MIFGISSISIHDKGNMLRNWALFEGSNKELMGLLENPFGRGRA